MWCGRFAAAGLLTGITACTSVRSVPPAIYLEDHAPPVVWVTYYANNTVVPVAEPEVKRDTLRGLLQGARVKIPLSEIRTVEAKVPNRTGTVLLAVGVGAGVVATMYFAFISGGTNKPGVDCTGDEVTKHPDEHPECEL